jgi:hypothetical protein
MKEESATALLREAEEVTPLYHSTADGGYEYSGGGGGVVDGCASERVR